MTQGSESTLDFITIESTLELSTSRCRSLVREPFDSFCSVI